MSSILIFSFLFNIGLSCRIDTSIHGNYKMQSNSLMTNSETGKNQLIYEEITITATSISNYGDCYHEYGPSYILGLKRMGRSICFKCVTPILLSQNVLQLAHQYEENCYDTEKDAKMTCFDSSLVTISDGRLLFRSSDEQAASCSPIDGRFEVAYRMTDAPLSCESGVGTTANNCQSSNRIAIQFRNCKFPNFDMSLRCIGSWKDNKKQQYFIVLNEENEEYRCGIVIEEPNVRKLYFANDSTCSSLSMKTAFDSYYFHSGSIAKPFAPCNFPVWMQGEFDSMTVSTHELQYLQPNIGAVPLISHCVQTFEDRVMVYSETKCGEPLGYHCLLFNARSQNLIEFKTTLPSDKSNTTVCMNNTQWDTIPWSSSVVLNTSPYPCGILGTFSTPRHINHDYCYDVSFDCENNTQMNITAYHCDDGVIFDSKSYTCLASWKHDDRLLVYVSRGSEENECFVTNYRDGKLNMIATGDQCDRNIKLEQNEKEVMILQEKKSCRRISMKSRKQPQIIPKTHGITHYEVNNTTPIADETTALSVLSDEFWFSDSYSFSYFTCFFTTMIIYYFVLV